MMLKTATSSLASEKTDFRARPGVAVVERSQGWLMRGNWGKLTEEEARERFWSYTERGGRNGRCKVWMRYRNKDGYGRFSPGTRLVGTAIAYRVAWIWQKGPIPDDMELDHMCRNRACVNVGHLRRVPKGWNREQGVQTIRDKPAPTHCKWGHERTPENIRPRGSCKTCRKIDSKLRYERSKGK